MSKRIALFGGSFDPPHLGHKALVDTALQTLKIDEVWVIPVGLPVHRQLSGKASNQDRLYWLTAMFADTLDVRIMDWEINQNTPTPAIATLRRFKAENPSITPLWLMGMDSFLGMPHWVEFPQHQDVCNVAVFTRKGSPIHAQTYGWRLVEANQQPQQAGHMCWLDVDLPHISASQIRENPRIHSQGLHQDTCNAIVSCYASDDTTPNKREKHE
ncbi:MAG: nicotinate (nicotinamide) nucleotide adenylyltransferase [Ghiorsea sp.]|nr:nicotinate (nicotinamide) nucleotide adenylyltransferase [Ghiorsea sp.]